MSQCTEGCTTDRPLRRGLCTRHYNRLRRNGAASALTGRFGPPSRVWEHVLVTDTCWLWTGTLGNNGYGSSSGRPAHRVVYGRLVGPVPNGLELDHLCRVRRCVRPDHLEPVTHAVNIARGVAARTVTA